MHQKTQGQYAVAAKKANIAIVLTIISVVLVLVLWLVIVGIIVGGWDDQSPCRLVVYTSERGYREWQSDS